MPEEVTVAATNLAVGAVADAMVRSFVGPKATRTPTKMTLLGASSLRLGADDFRTIMSSTEINGETIYVVTGTSNKAADAAWRKLAVLAQATAKWTEVATLLRAAGLINPPFSDDGELVESLQYVFDAIRQARERLQALPRSDTKPMETLHVLRR